MDHAAELGWDAAEAERAFVKAVRAQLAIHREFGLHGRGAGGVREIRLDAITGTVEAHRAVQFDREFRPSPRTRRRWIAVWLAEQRGTVLPPISVTPVGDAYAIRDGHHRVSVARARGAVTIAAAIS